MPDNKIIAIVGYSGHGYVVADAAISSGLCLKYYVEKNRQTKNPFQLEYLGFDGDPDFPGFGLGYSFILAVGNNMIRQQIAHRLSKNQETLVSVVHPGAILARTAEIGRGVFISKGALINSLANVRDFTIINTGAIIEHECIIDCAAHIAPGAVLAGNVMVGERSFIGANVTVRQGIRIGKDVIIGAGAVVVKDVPDNHIIVGNPAKRIK